MPIQSIVPTNSQSQQGIGKISPNITPSTAPSAPPPSKGFFGNAIDWLKSNALPIGGAVVGGIAGEALDPFGGGIPGALFGMGLAGAGGAAGETAQQGIENIQGTRKGLDAKQIATTGATSTLAEGAGKLIAPAAKLGIKAISFLGNVDENLMLQAFKSPQSFVPGFKGGADFLGNVVKNVGDSLGKYSEALSAKYTSLLQPIANDAIKGGQESVTNLVGDVNKLLTERNIVPGGGGIYNNVKQFIGNIPLEFEGKTPSSIVQGGERKAIQTAYNTINGLQEEVPTVGKLNAVIKTLGELRNFSHGGGDAATEILGRMYHAVDTFIEKEAPQLASIRDEVKPSIQLLNNIREIVPQKAGDSMSAGEIDAAKAKLLNLFKTGYGETKKAVIKYGEETGNNIINDVGGVKLSGAKLEGLAKIPPSSTQGIDSKFTRLLPQEFAKLPVRFPNIATYIQHLSENGVGENTIRTILQSMYQSKK